MRSVSYVLEGWGLIPGSSVMSMQFVSPMGTGKHFLEVKKPEREVDHSSMRRAKAKHERVFTSSVSIYLDGLYLLLVLVNYAFVLNAL
jgi:hypothetical protein